MFESKINKGRANGYAPLDKDGKVPLNSLPPIQSTIATGSFATTSSLQTLINSTASFATTGSNQFNGNQSISGSLTVSSTIINNSDVYLTGSDLIVDAGNLYVSGTVNVSGSVVVSSTYVNTATVNLNSSDFIIQNGYIILSASIAPTTSTGSVNDKKGMIAVSNNYLYYCASDYRPSGSNTTHVYNVWNDVRWNGYHDPGTPFLQTGTSQDGDGTVPPQAGWYFVDDLGTVVQILNTPVWFGNNQPSPTANGAGWVCVADTNNWVYSDSNPTLTFYESYPLFNGGNIWRRIAFETGSW